MVDCSEISTLLQNLKQQNLFRELNVRDGLDFSSNDYLALSKSAESLEAGIQAAKLYGSGSTGSRLLSGNKIIFEEFEKKIAKDKKTERAMIFNSGYIANYSVISAFFAMDYLMIFDKLNHASMYQGTDPRKLQRFNHLNYNQLEQILEKHKNCPKKFIASETVFGMDGDCADLEALSYLAKKYDAFLYLDEAHATGLYGENGYGLSTNFDFDSESTIIMGTFSKALASSGAHVASSSLIKDYLIQASKGFIYSTALSPFCIGVAQYNWNLLPQLKDIRKQLIEKSEYLKKLLTDCGMKYIGKNTNIVSIIFDSIEEMLQAHQKLLNKNIITSAIRRPTAPTPRIRLAINARHSYEDIDLLVSAIQ